MKYIPQHKNYLTAATGSVLGAVFVYWMLSILLVTPRIAIPLSIIVSMLIFGLTIYYNNLQGKYKETVNSNSIQAYRNQQDKIFVKVEKKGSGKLSVLCVGTLFSLLILICCTANNDGSQIFKNWDSINALDFIQLASGIMLCFFIPGYVIISIISQKYRVDATFAILSGYLISILITGLAAYISALLFDSAIAESKILFVSIYLIILASYFISFIRFSRASATHLLRNYSYYESMLSVLSYISENIQKRASEVLVFASLLGLIVTFTYVLFGGITIGDQWFHQGRALLFLSGSFKEATISQGETFYPPFQSAVIAALTTLSGTPVVNSYASIAFLNAVPMFAFYYFFLRWNSIRKKAGLLACALFTLSSGFGWLYLISSMESHNIITEGSSLDALRTMGHLDIVSASNFVIPTAPDFSTGLIYLALPAGFLLLAFLQSRFASTIINISLVVAIAVVGIISHYEFYIFIIIASLLPLILKIKQRNYIYAGILISIALVLLLNHTTPGDYYTSLRILGYPLIFLVAMFVSIMWGFYILSGYINKILQLRTNFSNSQGRELNNDRERKSPFKFIAATAIVVAFTYLYLLSFLVLGQLSLDTIRDQTSDSNVPWYLYPMKLGVAGILGIAFVLSLMFRKFEKEVLVFGVIVGISIITGPYYSESRFSKYVMIGMVGYASLMIHRILMWRFEVNAYRNVAILGTIVICSGLSILMFIGYNSLILQTQDFINTLPRRHFPSMQELNLLEKFYNNVDVNSNKYNVVSFPNEYNRWEDGFMAKVPSFVGLPYDKVRQSPLTLNSSTADNMFRQLSFSDTRYIVLPKHDIDKTVTLPTRFAIDHFNMVYQDKDIRVFEFPDSAPPTSSPTAEIGLVYNDKPNSLLPQNASLKMLQYNNTTFNLNYNSEKISENKDNQSQSFVLTGSHRQNTTTLWSKNLNSNGINSIETWFRISLSDPDKGNNYVGLKWSEGQKEYFFKFLNRGLELYERTEGSQQYKLLLANSEVEKRNVVWYKVNIQSLNNSIVIYINDRQLIEVPKSNSESQGITKIGLSSFHNDVEFKPIKVWTISETPDQIQRSKYFDYYYPFSILALSKSKYDVFRAGDLSVLSNKIILLIDDKLDDNDVTNSYLEYVQSGGTLIVINSDNNFQRTLGKYYKINSTQGVDEPFSGITLKDNKSSLMVSGKVKAIALKSLPELNITAWYRNDNNEVIAPFAIEKSLSKGKIVLINAGAYFNSLSNFPKQYFSSISKVSSIISTEDSLTQSEGQSQSQSQVSALPMKGIIGGMEASGRITINSSSLTFTKESDYPHELKATKIKILNGSTNFPLTLNNTTIENLRLYGMYDVLVNVTGKMKFPSMGSDGNYFSLSVPNNFDMKVRLHPQSSSKMEIFISNNETSPIRVNNNSLIEFHGLKSSVLRDNTLLIKEPKISVDGNTSISNSNFNGFLNGRGELNPGSELMVQGRFKATFDYVDNYHERSNQATKIRYVSYLDSVEMAGVTYPKQQLLKLPGDISFFSSQNGQGIPLTKIIFSTANYIILLVLIVITVIIIYFIRFRTNRTLKV